MGLKERVEVEGVTRMWVSVEKPVVSVTHTILHYKCVFLLSIRYAGCIPKMVFISVSLAWTTKRCLKRAREEYRGQGNERCRKQRNVEGGPGL